MPQAPGALLRHCRGPHDVHYDLVIGYGRRCPTLRVIHDGLRFTWKWSILYCWHYIDFSGFIADARGIVCRIWYGQVTWTLAKVTFGGWHLAAHGRIPVVPPHFRRTLPRT